MIRAQPKLSNPNVSYSFERGTWTTHIFVRSCYNTLTKTYILSTVHLQCSCNEADRQFIIQLRPNVKEKAFN